MTGRGARWSPLRNLTAASIFCAVVGGLVFANAPANEFAYDDVPIVVENEALQDLSRLDEVVTHPYWWPSLDSGRELGLWRPITSGALALQWAAWDGNPAGFHAVNVALHALVTALVVLLLAELLPLAGALAGGLIFAVHPVHVEAVANVVGFAELLGAAFFLGACLLFLRRRERPGPGTIVGISLLYVLSFLTKEGGVTLPAVLFLLDAYHDDVRVAGALDYVRRRWLLYAGLLIGGGLVLIGRAEVLGVLPEVAAPYGAQVLTDIPRIWTVAATWPHYVRLLFFPLDLSADYSPAVIRIAFRWTPQALIGLVTGLAFLLLALLTWRREELAGEPARPISTGIVWFGITILPVSNLFFLSGILLAERTIYLPSVGFCLAAGWALALLYRRRRAAALGLVAAVVVLFAARTWTRTPSWQSNLVLFQGLVEEHPEASRGQWILAGIYRQQGRPEAALKAFRLAAGNLDGAHQLLVELTRMLLEDGRHEEAERMARFIWHREPERPEGPVLTAVALSHLGRWEDALEAATVAIRLDPTAAHMHHLRATALARAGRLDAAIAARRRTISAGEEEHWQQWNWLAQLHAEAGDTGRALAKLDSARLRVDRPLVICQIDSIAAVWRGGESAGNCNSVAESKGESAVQGGPEVGDVPP